ncbi:MAG: hypothetical protein JSR36_19350 [Proteobacteria bacterium]|nr:hypothetical protein [Pseudomonadota bacterium]
MATTGSGRDPSRAGALLVSAAFLAVGAAVLALAAGWIPGDPRAFAAPRWVVGCMGVMFFVAGLLPLGALFKLPSWFDPLVGLVVASTFATVINWVAFFPGERHFSGRLSVLWLRQSAATGATSGRIMFGLGAVRADLLVLNALWRIVRGRGKH